MEPKPVTVRPRPASSSALSSMNHHHHSQNTSNSSSPPHHGLSVLAKVLRLFRSHSDSSMPRPPSPPRRRAAPPRSSSASPCTLSAHQQASHLTASSDHPAAFLAAAVWGGQWGGHIFIWEGGPRISDDIIHD